MTQVNIDKIKNNWLVFLNRIEAGEAFLILKAGKPVAEIKPISTSTKELRPFGLCEGEFTVPDDFDDPLPDEIIAEFG